MFKPKEEESTVEGIVKQITILNSIQDTHLGYLNIITDASEDVEERIAENQLMKLRQRCQLVALALSIALDNMPQWKNWNKCCEEAVQITKKMGITANPQVIRNWYKQYKVKHKFYLCFSSKHDLPLFLHDNKDICSSIQRYACENLAELSVELLYTYIHGVSLPLLVKEASGLSPGEQEYEKELKTQLRKYGLTKVCPSMVCKWMHQLGFRYETRKKGY